MSEFSNEATNRNSCKSGNILYVAIIGWGMYTKRDREV